MILRDFLDNQHIKNERIYFNKAWETQHETNVAIYTNALETFYDSEGISKIVRSVKLKSC